MGAAKGRSVETREGEKIATLRTAPRAGGFRNGTSSETLGSRVSDRQDSRLAPDTAWTMSPLAL